MGILDEANAKLARQRYEEQRIQEANAILQAAKQDPAHEFHYVRSVNEEVSGWLQEFAQFMQGLGIAPIPGVVVVVNGVERSLFNKFEVFNVIPARFRGWPILQTREHYAVTEQGKLAKARLTSREELVGEGSKYRRWRFADSSIQDMLIIEHWYTGIWSVSTYDMAEWTLRKGGIVSESEYLFSYTEGYGDNSVSVNAYLRDLLTDAINKARE